jgi:hypothetical protein
MPKLRETLRTTIAAALALALALPCATARADEPVAPDADPYATPPTAEAPEATEPVSPAEAPAPEAAAPTLEVGEPAPVPAAAPPVAQEVPAPIAALPPPPIAYAAPPTIHAAPPTIHAAPRPAKGVIVAPWLDDGRDRGGATEMSSPALVSGGIVLTLLGAVGALGGAGLKVVSSEISDRAGCGTPNEIALTDPCGTANDAGEIGTIALIGSGAALAVGVPMIFIGTRQVPVKRETALAPEVHLGPTSAQVAVRF